MHRAQKTALGLFVLSLSFQVLGQANLANKTSAAQLPKTAPATELILSSYEGQNVTGIEIAGRPGLNVSQLTPLFALHAGQPFSTQKIEQTVDRDQNSGHFSEVQLQVEPEPNGVQVLLVLEPAVYFGLFEFPGAKRFAYSRLLQQPTILPRRLSTARRFNGIKRVCCPFSGRRAIFSPRFTPK